MKRISTLVTSIVMLIAILAATTMASLAWFELTPVARSGLNINAGGYITFTYQALPSFYNGTSYVQASDFRHIDAIGEDIALLPAGTVSMSPDTVKVNSIRNGFVSKTDEPGEIDATGTSTKFKSSVQYINHTSHATNTKTLLVSARAYALMEDQNGEHTAELSLQSDLHLTTSVQITYYDNSSVTYNDNEYAAGSVSAPIDSFGVNFTDQDATIVLISECSIRQVDELVRDTVRNAKAIYIDLTVSISEYKRILYYYNYYAWHDVSAYSWGYERISCASAASTEYLIAGIDGNDALGIRMRPDPNAGENEAFIYNGLVVDVGTTGIQIVNHGSAVSNPTLSGVGTKSGNTIQLPAGTYDIKYTVASNTIKVTSNAQLPLSAYEYLGPWNSTKLTAVPGLTGWFSVELPYMAEEITFSDGHVASRARTPNNQQTGISVVNVTNCYLYNGEWLSSVTINTDHNIYFYNDMYEDEETPVDEVTAICYEESGENSTEYEMTDLGNGWFLVHVPEDTDFSYINFAYGEELTRVTKLSYTSGAPYYDNGRWYDTPPAH